MRGEEGDAYEAVAKLIDSLKIEPARKDCLNSLGVAFYYTKNPAKAKECFLEALKLDPAYDLPLFNLGRLALELGDESECRKYWSEYLELDTRSPWAMIAKEFLGTESPKPSSAQTAKQEKEKAREVKIGDHDERVRRDWGTPRTQFVPLERYPYKISTFPTT